MIGSLLVQFFACGGKTRLVTNGKGGHIGADIKTDGGIAVLGPLPVSGVSLHRGALVGTTSVARVAHRDRIAWRALCRFLSSNLPTQAERHENPYDAQNTESQNERGDRLAESHHHEIG